MCPRRISRQAVLDAVRPLFTGCAGPTMEEAAGAAGISSASLYKLFRCRAGLLAELGVAPPPTPTDRIVAAAASLVADAGLSGLSVEEAASAAGVSRGAAYRFFPGGKNALFNEVVRRYLPFGEARALVTALADRPPQEVLPRVAALVADLDRTQAAVMRAAAFERDPGTPGANAIPVDLLDAFSAYMEAQMDAGRLRRMNPFLAAVAWSSPVAMFVMNRDLVDADRWGGLPVAAALRELVDVWLRAMCIPTLDGRA